MSKNHDAFGEAFAEATVVRAFEPPEEVVVSNALAHSPELQPEDYGVLIRLLLRDPDQPSSVEALSAEFQASGWKMGEKRLREVMKRLKKAGHVDHDRSYSVTLKRPVWQFKVFRNPANNQAYVNQGTTEASQVRPTRHYPADQGSRPDSDPAEFGGCAGQADPAEFGGSARTRRNSADPNGDETAGRSRPGRNRRIGASPPLPPGGGGGSSPYPLNDDAQPQQDKKEPSVEELAAAVAFLQELPDPWVIGDRDAKQIAPELLAQMQRMEWPSILDVDRQLLVIPLTSNPGGANNLPSILRRRRIPDLPTYSRVAARAAKKSSAPAEGKCPKHPAFNDGDCSPCRIAERERTQRGKSEPAGIDGAGLLARLRAGMTNN